MKDLILLGLPGAGKGTQASYISEKYKIPHISTGDMFREAIKNETDLGKEAKKFIDAGELVPDSVTNGIVKERLAQSDTKNGFLLDGFPRTIVQAEVLDEILKEGNRSINAALYIKVDKSILKERLSGRFICVKCAATYHKLNKPTKIEGVCDVCGSTEFYQRDDDKPETVEKRIVVNESQTNDLVDFYEKKDIINIIDGQQDPSDVFEAIKSILR